MNPMQLNQVKVILYISAREHSALFHCKVFAFTGKQKVSFFFPNTDTLNTESSQTL